MNLLIDVGNSRVKWSIYNQDKIFEYNTLDKLDFNFFRDVLMRFSDVKNVAYCNNKEHNNNFLNKINHLDVNIYNVSETLVLPFESHYNSIQNLGCDRIALCCGAVKNYMHDILVVDLGTCITYDLIINKEHLGGQISPGLNIRFRSVNSFTKKLPLLKFNKNIKFIGDSTKTSLEVGIADSVLFEIDGVIKKYIKKYPKLKVVITGGDYKFFENKLKKINFSHPYLLMDGLNYIIALNENKN